MAPTHPSRSLPSSTRTPTPPFTHPPPARAQQPVWPSQAAAAPLPLRPMLRHQQLAPWQAPKTDKLFAAPTGVDTNTDGESETRAEGVAGPSWGCPPHHPEESNEVLPADDRYLGVWINDAQKDDCNWYLLQGALPCFIIQELPEAEQRHEEASENFFHRYRYTNTEYNLVPHASPLLNLSLWIDLATEAPLMKRRMIIGGLRSPSLTVAGMEFAKKTWELQDKVLRAKAGSETNVQPGGEVSIDPARAPWLRAPEIIQSGPGPWMTFREHLEDDSDEPFMLQLGQRSDEQYLGDGDVMFWDRAHNHRLIFEGTPALEEGAWLTTSAEFGQPVPKWPFKKRNDRGGFKDTSRSEWMYPHEKPHPTNVGRVLIAPEPRHLPELKGGHYEEAAGAWAQKEDKSDGVSLGPGFDVEMEGVEADHDNGREGRNKGLELIPPAAPDARAPPPLPKHYSVYQPLLRATTPQRLALIVNRSLLKAPPLVPPARVRNPPSSMNNVLASSSSRPMDQWAPPSAPSFGDRSYPSSSTSLAFQFSLRSKVAIPGPTPSNSSPTAAFNYEVRLQPTQLLAFPEPRTTPSLLPIAFSKSGSAPPSFLSTEVPIAARATNEVKNPFPGSSSWKMYPARNHDGLESPPGRTPLDVNEHQVATLEPVTNVEMPLVSVYQRLDVPLEERIREVKERRKRQHKRAERRVNREAREAAARREKEERILQVALLQDAAAQPAPALAPEEPYEEPPYPEDFYS
ncbi:hypothetical protein C8F04DRAFT_1268551 [Mycena alexandri]|uniref:Uncharacterized protein n=1 Tax=Mycena alexandri TaxID=1745969 RepID=A0AAD6SH83_9AGAR|nr:hypothetical protein C8F04DRAFT_1268551 [Mycena alexandri]